MPRLTPEELAEIGRDVGLEMAKERHPPKVWAQLMMVRLGDAVEAAAQMRRIRFMLRDADRRKLVDAFRAGLAEGRRS